MDFHQLPSDLFLDRNRLVKLLFLLFTVDVVGVDDAAVVVVSNF